MKAQAGSQTGIKVGICNVTATYIAWQLLLQCTVRGIQRQ